MLAEVWSCLTIRRRRQFWLISILMVTTSLLEIISIGSLLPFLSVLIDPDIQVYPGGLFKTTGIESPTKDTYAKAVGVTKEAIEITRTGEISEVYNTLTLDYEVETEIGEMTVREYCFEGRHGKLKAQARDRGSNSWNAYINRHENGIPFFYDNGMGIKYKLEPDEHLKYVIEVLDGTEKNPSRDVLVKLIDLVAGVHTDALGEAELEAKLKALTPKSLKIDALRAMIRKAKKQDQKASFTQKKWDMDEIIPVTAFSDVAEGGEYLKKTLKNLKCMMDCYGITSHYNAISKKSTIKLPNRPSTGDGAASFNAEMLISQAALCGLPTSGETILKQAHAIGYDDPVNPVVDYMETLQWDGTDYIKQLADCITVGPEHTAIRDQMIRLWMIQACAAADAAEQTPNKDAMARYEYVWCLLGDQGVQKTKFYKNMVPEPLREYFKDGVALDPSDKDSVIKATGNWFVELGELDATFRKADLSRLKAFLSEEKDVYRTPYGRTTDSHTRRTVFTGSVNEPQFLRDGTGNRRYWPLNAISIKLPTSDIVCGAWSQAWALYIKGDQWWPTKAFEKQLDSHRTHFGSNSSKVPNVL